MTHMIFGLIAISAGLVGVFAWWDDFGLVLRGLVPLALMVVGLVAIGAGLIPQGHADEGREQR